MSDQEPLDRYPMRIQKQVSSLAEHFLQSMAKNQGIDCRRMEDEAADYIVKYDWSRNHVRKLKIIMERLSANAQPLYITVNEVKNEIRKLEKALHKNINKDKKAKSLKTMKHTFEKSVVAACDIPKGTMIKLKHLAYKKPGDGINAKYYKDVIGKKLKIAIKKNHKFAWEDIE